MDIIEAFITTSLFVFTFWFFSRIIETTERTSKMPVAPVFEGENDQGVILPEDVITNILSLLPVKSIARFSCASKYWYNKLLKDPILINLHLKQSIESERFNCFSINDASEFYLHISKSSSLSAFEDDYYEKPVEMDSPFESQVFQNQQIQCYDSRNGLILMRSLNSTTKEEVLYLWNPATKEFKDIIVPKVDCDYNSFDGPAYGFGYNCDTDDYTIMKATDGCVYDSSLDFEACFGSIVQVYSLRSDSWRTLPDIIPYKLVSPKAAVSTNFGVLLHWIAAQVPCSMDSLGREVVSFDIRDNNFRKVPLTPQVDELVCDKNNRRSLGVLRGCLCIAHYGDYNVEVWAMKDYKVRESWTKLFIAQLPFERPLCYMKLLWELKNGEVLFIAKTYDDVYFVVYDSVHQKSEVTKMHHHLGAWTGIYGYVESLVALGKQNTHLPLEYK